MNKDQQIAYHVCFKGAVELMRGRFEQNTTASVAAERVFALTDALYEQMTQRMGAAPAAPPPAAQVPPSPPQGAPVQTTAPVGQGDCPQCHEGTLQYKAAKDGSRTWKECSNRRRQRTGEVDEHGRDIYEDVGTCTYVDWG